MSELCIGIASRNDNFELAMLEHGKFARVMKFPATRMGVEAIKSFLTNYPNPVRLAVAGASAVNLALALGSAPGREAFIVSSTVADQAVALAHFAEHSA